MGQGATGSNKGDFYSTVHLSSDADHRRVHATNADAIQDASRGQKGAGSMAKTDGRSFTRRTHLGPERPRG